MFDDVYERVSSNEWIYLERLRAHIDELASATSDRLTAQHIVKHMDAMDPPPDPRRTFLQPRPDIPNEEPARPPTSP